MWQPKVSARQADIINATEHFLLIHGPRMSGKTRGILHRVCKHLWMENRARVILFAKTIKSAAVAGSYRELVDDVVPEWMGGGFGFQYTVPPKTDAGTRTHHFKTTNRHGTESELFLFSVDHDREVEEKVKNVKATMIYFIELSNFKSRIVFDATFPSLRSDTVPFERRCWIGDTNPAEDGTDSWIHKLWMAKEVDPHGTLDDETKELLLANLREIQVLPEQNPFKDEQQWKLMQAAWAHSLDLTARYVHGHWVEDISKGHFADVWMPERHVVGDIGRPQSQQEVLVPSENCSEMITATDPGDRFQSSHFIEKVFTDAGTVFCVVDEIYNDGELISLKDWTEAMMEVMDKYEGYVRQHYQRDLTWRHWGDAAVNNHWKSASGAYDANTIYHHSGGRIRMISAPKGSHSVKRRVDIIRKLLHEDRLLVSAKCVGTIEMLKKLKKGKGEIAFVARDKLKHRFDSLSYALDAEEPMDAAMRYVAKQDVRGKVIQTQL